jgi:hypothetical protein
VERLYPAEATITLNGAGRKAMADQIATASKRRLQRRVGALGKDDPAPWPAWRGCSLGSEMCAFDRHPDNRRRSGMGKLPEWAIGSRIKLRDDRFVPCPFA